MFYDKIASIFRAIKNDEERCGTIFKAISKLDYAMHQIVAKNLSQKKITDFFNNV